MASMAARQSSPASRSTKDRGEPLQTSVRSQMGLALGADLSAVHVHTGPRADAVARSADAAAVTEGSDIWFADGRFDPGSVNGRLLLAHELAHVVQQRPATAGTPNGAANEADANTAAVDVMTKGAAAVRTVAAPSPAAAANDELEKLKSLYEGAVEQMSQEGLHKRLVGAAGEGSMMGKLANEGIPHMNVNKLAGGGFNFPHIDLLTKDAPYSLKVRGPVEALDEAAHGRLMGRYMTDLRRLARPDDFMWEPGKAAKAADRLVENAPALKKAGLLPESLEHSAEAVGGWLKSNARLAIPEDHAIALRKALPKAISDSPGKFLEEGENLETGIKRMVSRVEGVGLNRAQLGELETRFRAGTLKKGGMAALAALSGAVKYHDLSKSGHDKIESAAGGLGETGGVLASTALKAKGGGVALADAALHLVGAPHQVTEASSVLASGTAAGFIPAVMSEGARAYTNLGKAIGGDTKGIDRQVLEMRKGKAGAPLQGFAQLTEIGTSVASGKKLGDAIYKAGSVGQDSAAAHVGNTFGNAAYTMGEVGKNIAKGDSLATAVMKAPHIKGDGEWIEKGGNWVGDQTYQVVNKDIPEAIEFAKRDASKAILDVKSTVTATATDAKDKLKHLFGFR
jgi:hypothetical protein